MNKRSVSIFPVIAVFFVAVILSEAFSVESPTVQASALRPTATPSASDCGFICEAKANVRAICGNALDKDPVSSFWVEMFAFTEDTLSKYLSSVPNKDLTPFSQGMLVCGAILSTAKKEGRLWVDDILGRLPKNCDYECQVKFYTDRFCGTVFASIKNRDAALQAALRAGAKSDNPLQTAFLACALTHDILLKENCGWLCETDKEVRRVCRRFFSNNRTMQTVYEVLLDDIEYRVNVLTLDIPIRQSALLICNALQN